MIFDETLAREIINKFGLSEKTIRVWKNRGEIPDKYLNSVPNPVKKIERKDTLKAERLLKILESDAFNLQYICLISNVEYQKIYDCIRGKNNLNETEMIALKKTINQLKIDIAKSFTIFNILDTTKILNREEIKLNHILKSFTKSEIKNVYRIANKEINLDRAIWDKLKNDFIVFGLSLRID